MPQIRRVTVELRHAVEPPPTPAASGLLRLTGHVETPAERAQRVVKVIRTRTFGILSEEDLRLVLRPMLDRGR